MELIERVSLVLLPLAELGDGARLMELGDRHVDHGAPYAALAAAAIA
jgi:hypothetical protein